MAVSRNPYLLWFTIEQFDDVTIRKLFELRHTEVNPVILKIAKVSKLPLNTYNEIPEVPFKPLNQTTDQ